MLNSLVTPMKSATLAALLLCAGMGTVAASGMKDIVDTAVDAGQFTTLVTAVQRAGLVETLKGEGPFTVFAPNDDAFARVPEAVLAQLLADPEMLAQVLTYHVVAGKVTSAEVVKLRSATSIEGSMLNIDSSAGVKVENATVIAADIMTSNGVIHVIDTVMVPQQVLDKLSMADARDRTQLAWAATGRAR